MDGWRGSRLGYAGGRTGWFANYGNNDSLRGTGGFGSTNSYYNRLRQNRDSMTNFIAGLGLVGGLYMLAEYRGRNTMIKTIANMPGISQAGKAAQTAVDTATNLAKDTTNAAKKGVGKFTGQ